MSDELTAFFARLPGRLDEHATQTSMPGACTAIIRNGDTVFVHGCGETLIGTNARPTADTVFRIASMTKSFTAVAIMMLRDRGALRLDDPITTYLPWTQTIGAPVGSPPITVRDLLTMNGGFPTDDPWGDRHEPTPIAEFDALVAGGLTFSRMPRTGFEYSNLGYALLGRIVTVVSGIDYLEFVAREILQPLGMHATAFHTTAIDEARRAHGYVLRETGLVPEPTTPPGAFSPMGGLHSTVRDLATWVTGFLSAWDANAMGLHPLARASRREMQEGRTFRSATLAGASDASAAKTIVSLYGYGLAISIDSVLGTFVHHSGGYPGFGSHMRWHPASGWGIVMLANRSYAPVYEFAADLLSEVVATDVTPADVGATLWPATREAMDVAETLLARWSDDLADRSFAFNVDLDTPRAERRDACERIAAAIGPFRRRDDGWTSTSPAHVKWSVRGAQGDAEIEILLTPERSPKLQTLTIAALPATP
jgi:CubicO group peptidase (beta-lactamase class C family)